MKSEKPFPAMHLTWLVMLILMAEDRGVAAEHWVSHGPCGGSTSVLLPSQHPEGGLYAAVLGYGVYATTPDAATTWIRRSDGIENLFIKALAQGPAQPDILYAATRTGIFRTTDGGLLWEPGSGGLDVGHVEALAIAPSAPQVLYAGAVWGAHWCVYKTVDAGETWEPTGPGIPDGLHIAALLVDPADSDIVYVGVEDPYVPRRPPT